MPRAGAGEPAGAHAMNLTIRTTNGSRRNGIRGSRARIYVDGVAVRDVALHSRRGLSDAIRHQHRADARALAAAFDALRLPSGLGATLTWSGATFRYSYDGAGLYLGRA